MYGRSSVVSTHQACKSGVICCCRGEGGGQGRPLIRDGFVQMVVAQIGRGGWWAHCLHGPASH